MAKPSKALKAVNTAKKVKDRQLAKAIKKAEFAVSVKKVKDRQLAKAKGQEAAALTKLTPIAKEINTRLDKAEKMSSDAFDHRLAAAIRLEDARKMCEKAGVHFKKWVEANVTQSYETVRKLVTIGGSADPALALADLRLTTRKAVAKHAAKKKMVLANANNPDKGGIGPTPSGTPSRTPWEIAEDMVASLSEKEQLSLIDARANLIGRKVITADDSDILKAAKAPGQVSATVVSIKKAFKKMKASDKMKFLNWAATEVGATVESSVGSNGHDAPIPETGGEAIPDSLRR